MPKNIIICLDGTGNKLTLNENSNVVHLYSCLEKSDRQITFYSPGIGTLVPEWIAGYKKKIWSLLDQIIGGSLEKSTIEAYSYLIDHFETGDQIYLFGFSRGAYTARVICGMVQMFGLLEKGNYAHIKHLFKLYTSKNKINFKVAARIKKSISRPNVAIRFLGIWDTVSSIGSPFVADVAYPYTRSLKIAKTVRHAVAIDERRKLFLPLLVNPQHKDVLEVYFAGVHSDVGGSYPREGLSKVAMEWMLWEAFENGLYLNMNHVNHYVYGLGKNKFQSPDPFSPLNDSMDWFFRLIQILPRKEVKIENLKEIGYTRSHVWHLNIYPFPRKIDENAILHESVIKKIKECPTEYRPVNINLKQLDTYTVIKTKRQKKDDSDML